MKRIIIIFALVFTGIIAKAQKFEIESNKILSIEKLAEIKGDTLFIYKDLDKALEILNKSKSHKPFKYIIIHQLKLEVKGNYYENLPTTPNSGTLYYPNGWGGTTNLWIDNPLLKGFQTTPGKPSPNFNQ